MTTWSSTEADDIRKAAARTKAASRLLAKCPTSLKNAALLAMAERLEKAVSFLVTENKRDLTAGMEKGLSRPLLSRLSLMPKGIEQMAVGLREVAALPDPIGEIIHLHRRPNGMQVGQMRVPIGVIGIIYESRPNVTADVAGLCIKSGNGVVLRGGSEAIHSNRAIAHLLREAAEGAGLPPDCITLIQTTDRQAIFELLKLEASLDLIIPRGGSDLIQTVVAHSRIPVMKHDKGLCHTFVDDAADLTKAEAICLNAKVQRPETCNAMETLLVHQAIAESFLPGMIKRYEEAGVEIRGCPETIRIVGGHAKMTPAAEEDWTTEYLDLILSIKVIPDIDAAIEHISRHGSQHSDAIVTQNHDHAMRFLNEVDAAAVFVNASTRLNDGYEFGLGAEIGISTSRIHARGPMGLEALTCHKYIVLGTGQLRG